MNFLEIFSKSHQTFLCKLFGAEGETERGTDIMNRNYQFWYDITNALHIYRRPAKFLAFLQRVQSISHYCLSGRHGYTCSPLPDTNSLILERPSFKNSVIQNFIVHCMFTLLTTSLPLFTEASTLLLLLLLILFIIIIIAGSSDECSEHKSNPVIVFMPDFRRTVIVQVSNRPV
jgi:hypothetical protein